MMSNLTKRIDILESRDKGEPTFVWVSPAPDGLEHGGQVYGDDAALLCALGLDADEAILLGWQPATLSSVALPRAEN